ncbi:Gurmarin/antimicrobial peptide [Metarhizium rileyi]|uniref:Gurmarin/antimicrobial peptide n=1 Tax=Metarhizium rileyi (strain RCEF 4871) TaxID=1649241 RepID=A0A167DEH6_METRR|nr:Gurmarin/antimicrobial peptide [Metarhizium rileyi RCEF 4871]TWU72447.1 hypothetical protein ED733_003661 [Metarhizium rileyi]
MKFAVVLTSLFAGLAMAKLDLQPRGQCIDNDKECKRNGDKGNCCSGYCLVMPGSDDGHCKDK